MQFTTRKRRHPPAIIIIALIDVLIVVLIFLIVTTTFKQQPAVTLALPQSREARPGSGDAQHLVITIPKEGSPLFLGTQPMTLARIEEKLLEAMRRNPDTTLSIRADTGAPFGQIIQVMDAAKAANIERVNAFIKPK